MFLLGFFSVLDAILDQFMEQVLEEISLDPGIKDALINAGSPNAIWIELLDELDRGNWPRLEAKAARMNLTMELIDRAAIEASTWTAEVMGSAA
jgi:EAL and modified HD-GYP domain-containing signal transduction protein